MTTGTIMLYTGAAMIIVSILAGIPAMIVLLQANKRIRRQVYTDFH